MNKRSALIRFQYGLLALFITLLTAPPAFSQVRINEVVSSNGTTFADEDRDFPDWIELYNTSDSIINLEGYGISDDLTDPFKYILPEIVLPPDSYYLIFASDKDRAGFTAYWETIIKPGNPARYIIPDSNTGNDWINSSYDDSGWDTGAYGIGYGDNDDVTVTPTGIHSVFARNTFTIQDLTKVKALALHVDYDDGYIAYLNGMEISRMNIEGVAPVPYNTSSSSYTEPRLIYGYGITGSLIENFKDLLTEGENVFAIQMHNFGTSSSDLTLIPFLSIGYDEPTANGRGAATETRLPDEQKVFTHTNFKLSSAGETVILTRPDSVTADQLTYPSLRSDESYGRGLGTDSGLYIYSDPTPLEENSTTGYQERLDPPVLLNEGGFYLDNVPLILLNDSLANSVHYTLDGSDPDINSPVLGTIDRNLHQTTVLKLRTIKSGKLSSEVVTHTFLIDEVQNLPVVSVSTDPYHLWSDEAGIYVKGTNGIEGNGSDGPANWNQDWEIPVHIEFFEKDGSKGFASGAGAKIFGGWSRLNPQKSLAIYFRGEYGNPELNYQLFEDKEITQFQAFVLRNSGNDFTTQYGTMFRDGLMTTLVEETGLEYQEFRPAVVYLNGEYWGIHNIREKINEHFLASNGYADSEEIDLLEGNTIHPDGWNVIHGRREKWDELLGALSSADMTDPEQYAVIEDMIDVNNYIDYMATQIYIANTDWPGNNIKFWRNRLTNGKWRWILYDTDFGFNLSYGGQTYHNTISFALEPSGPVWPNPPSSTFLFRKMSDNPVFVEKFSNRLSDLMNTHFEKDHVNQVIDSLAQIIEPEMPRHQERWGNSFQDWDNSVELLRSFANGRRSYIEGYVRDQFGLSIPSKIIVDVNNAAFGDVRVNRVIPGAYPWEGSYYRNNNIEISALPKKGYRFTGWTGSLTTTENPIVVTPSKSLMANFEPYESPSSSVVINEVMYNDSETMSTGDWIELTNPGDVHMDISGWQIKDDDNTHTYVFPSGTVLEAGSYVVVAGDPAVFNAQYEEVETLYGELGFGLGRLSDQVRLYDSAGELIDSLQYLNDYPWPPGPYGTGFTLELKDPGSDNADPLNWGTSAVIGGTPGAANSILAVNNEQEDNSGTPEDFHLFQNYPNPFNPSTNISFTLSTSQVVTLTVYDLLGRRVASLSENQSYPAGKHTLRFDASSLSNGLYMYRISLSNGQSRSDKMMLIK